MRTESELETAIPDSDAWLWWSTGKDSAWSLHQARERNALNITHLVTTVNAKFDRVAMHATRVDLLRLQASSLGLPLHIVEIPYPCPNETYELAVGKALTDAADAGVSHMVFGDLFLEDIRAYRERLLEPFDLSPVFPLWGEDTKELARQMIRCGVKAYITCVDPKVLDSSFAGRAFDDALLDALPRTVDPCGERGEFHTFVWDGPMFETPIQVSVGDIVRRDGFVFADIIPASPRSIM